VFELVFFTAAAVLALWIDARFPQLAPRSFSTRVLIGIVATFALPLVPVDVSSRRGLMLSFFGGVLPALVFAFLTGLWLLRAIRDVAQSQRL
jgi:hypothetical protein